MSETTTPVWTLGDRIRKARETAGYGSQAELAAAAGLSRATISNAENGRHTPHPLALRAIAEACHVPVGWLIGTGDIAREPSHPTGRTAHTCPGQTALPIAA